MPPAVASCAPRLWERPLVDTVKGADFRQRHKAGMRGPPDNRTTGPAVIWTRRSLTYAPRMDLDPGSRWPLSAQLAQLLRSEIRSGRLVVGDLLPSEHELAGEHGVSRETARRSLTMLADEGLITRRRGVGSIVADVVPGSRPGCRRRPSGTLRTPAPGCQCSPSASPARPSDSTPRTES